jgi:hypothetical protein
MRDPLAVQLLLADAGIPMIFLAFPAMLMLLVPIIVVEGFLCKKWLALTTWDAMKSNAVSNPNSPWSFIDKIAKLRIGLLFRLIYPLRSPDKNIAHPRHRLTGISRTTRRLGELKRSGISTSSF